MKYMEDGRNVLSAQKLEVSLLEVGMNGAPFSKGCVVNGHMAKASDR